MKRKAESWETPEEPDYTVWHGEDETTLLSTVTVEAKRQYDGSTGIPQALAYTGKLIILSLKRSLKANLFKSP